MRKLFVNQVELAKLEKITARYVRELEKKKVFRRDRNGRYELFKNNPLFIQYIRRQNEPDEMKAARLRRENAKALREELLAKQLEGSLVPRQEPIIWLTNLCVQTKTNFWSLPARLCRELADISDPREVHSVLKKDIRNTLNNLVEALKKKYKNIGELAREFRAVFHDFFEKEEKNAKK